ncbi:MAG: glycosyltransferase family 4 protein [Methanosarcina barkeri]|nr:glycosyltransferase family 4 protein [Methanosarcina sp. ERenArc_MAG2]
MRILVVQESDWIQRGPHNSHHLMERLSAKGHEIRVIDYEILWNESKTENNLISKRKVFYNQHKSIENGNITVIRPSIVKLPVLNYVSLLCTHYNEIKKQIGSFKPDVIVGLGILNANIAIKLAKNYHIPFVYYVMDLLHGLVPQKHFQSLATQIESDNMRKADRVISVNEGLREYTIEMGADRERTEVIRTGVDFNHFRHSLDGKPIREKYGIKDDEVVLFFMGWLYVFSGLKELASEVIKSKDNLKLLILGEGDLWNDLQKIKSTDQFNKITIVNWQPYEIVPEYVAAADVCLLPAHANDVMKYIVPIKIYEYLAMGKPVIATKLYGLVKEFEENNGVIYIDNPLNVLDKVKYLIKNQSLKREGQKGLEFVEKNNWDKITDDFELVLYKSIEIRHSTKIHS